MYSFLEVTELIYRNCFYNDDQISECYHDSVIKLLNVAENVTPPPNRYRQIDVRGQKVEVLNEGTDAELYLIGTNHASPESRMAVAELLDQIKPQIVVIELCEVRAGLTGSKVFVGLRPFNMTFLIDAIREIGFFPGMILYAMAYMERFISRILNVDYGGEMATAAINSKNLNYKIMLGDRRNDVTLKRMALSLPLWKKISLLFVTLLATIFGLRCTLLVVPVMLMMDKDFMNVMVHERDVYLTNSLQNAIRYKFTTPTKVIGIVGRGHIPGILSLWSKVNDSHVQEVMNIDRL